MTKFGQRSKTILVSVLVFAILIPCMFLLSACGKADFKADASIAKVSGITVSVDDEIVKKQFSTANGDSAGRVAKYEGYGELDQVTINVSGTVSRADCEANALARNANGDPVGADEAVNYYTDYFEFSMLIPDGATKYKVDDGLPAKDIAELDNVEKGYVVENVQWLLGGADKTGWSICGVADTNDGYFYYAFLNNSDEVVKEFFVRVVYDVEFVA